MITVYAEYSPPEANFIAKHDIFKTAVQCTVLTLEAVCYASLHFGYTIVATAAVLVFLLPIILVRFSEGEHSTFGK